MVSLISGITSTTLAIILFPLAIVMSRSLDGTMFIGFLGLSTIFIGLLGTICAAAKKLSTEDTPENKTDRAIANKGFWFSIIPTSIWIFIMILGSIR